MEQDPQSFERRCELAEDECRRACEEIETLLREFQQIQPSSLSKEILIHGAMATVTTMLMGVQELIFALLSTGASAAIWKGRDYMKRTQNGFTRSRIDKNIQGSVNSIIQSSETSFDLALRICADYKIDLYIDEGATRVSFRRLKESIENRSAMIPDSL